MSQWNNHLVRVGLLGRVGRFASSNGTVFPRGAQVICRTPRGLEVGEVLLRCNEPAQPAVQNREVDGTLIRHLTIEDRLLLQRLEQNRHKAFAACKRLMAQHQLDETLVDVEQLFDGQSIYFYFLGEISPKTEALMHQLTTAYEAEARIGEFATAVETGCGPDCGTESAAGCETNACASCAMSSACGAASG